MQGVFESINGIFSFIGPLSDFLWDFPTNFEWYTNIPILGNFSFAIILLVGSGIFFSFKLGFMQVTHFKKGIHIMTEKRNVETGISPLAAFLLSSAMRVGPVGWAFNTKKEVLAKAKESAECTHNHPEGIKGAQATALCVLMGRKRLSKEEIRSEISARFGYNLNFTCDEIRNTYKWGGTCQDTVPQSIVAFLDGKSFEDCIRYAVSIGGDSDTIACITGSIAEAYFGVPEELYTEAFCRLTPHFKNVVTEFEEKFGSHILK